MIFRSPTLDARLSTIALELGGLRGNLSPAVETAIDRWLTDAAALRFHLNDSLEHPAIVAILGGTGTGKSTLVNRLMEANLSATSFRRTYTAGAVALVAEKMNLPVGWLGVEHRVADAEELPAKGRPEVLIVVASPQVMAGKLTLIDTPDLDGDQPLHHVQADRVFRWAEAVLFLVTPEKYQMTELLPYYRLARRYAIPAFFAMNKCEESAVLEDYGRQLQSHFASPRIFAIPRDDAAWNAPPDGDLSALRAALTAGLTLDAPGREAGLANRCADLVGRLTDQVIAPLRDARREADRLIAALRNMEAPEPGVDVNPITQQLQKRLQQRSVLYLMGPGRMLDRVRQVPGLIVRLPRTLWDGIIHGKKVALNAPDPNAPDTQVPDFRANLVDQFAIVQSRMDDALRSNPLADQWLAERSSAYQSARVPPDRAGTIVDEELGDLRNWLEKRWNATPRDTALLLRLVRHLPGGERLVGWLEAMPYLMAIVLAAQHVLTHGTDLMIIGGFSLATWIGEKLSNEVTNHVRATNRRIGERFADLAHEQIDQLCQWLDQSAPPIKAIQKLERSAEELVKERPEGNDR